MNGWELNGKKQRTIAGKSWPRRFQSLVENRHVKGRTNKSQRGTGRKREWDEKRMKKKTVKRIVDGMEQNKTKKKFYRDWTEKGLWKLRTNLCMLNC